MVVDPGRVRLRLTAALPLPGPDGPSMLTLRPSRLVRGTSRASRKVRQRLFVMRTPLLEGFTAGGGIPYGGTV